MAYFRFMWLPIDVFASWGSARRVFGLSDAKLANRRRVFRRDRVFRSYGFPPFENESTDACVVSDKTRAKKSILLIRGASRQINAYSARDPRQYVNFSSILSARAKLRLVLP